MKTPKDIMLRHAETNDIAALAILNQNVQRLHFQHEPATFKMSITTDEFARHFLGLINQKDTQVIVALKEHICLGYIVFSVQNIVDSFFVMQADAPIYKTS